MKCLPFILASLLLPCLLSAQQPEKPSAYLEVKLAAGHNKVSHTFHATGAVEAATKQNSRQMAITITAGTLMHSPLDATVEWFFVGKDLAKKKELIFDRGKRDISILAGGFQEFDAVSKEVKSSSTNESLYGMAEPSAKLSGLKPDGYIVRIVQAGAVLALRASTPFLETAAQDPVQFKQLSSPAK